MKFASLLLASLVAGAQAQSTTTLYRFDSAHAAGVRGTITVQHASPDSSKAAVFAALDFSSVDKKAIASFDANCKADSAITEYKWHIHVKWGSKTRSASLQQCGKDLTGDHYDPTKACGPASEYAGTPECTAKTPSYACSPESYAKDFNVCEKGDLSGKFGSLKPDAKGKVQAKWMDEHFPLRSEAKPQWNIVLHAVCGTATPRIACAVGEEVKYPEGKEVKPTSGQGSNTVIGFVRIEGGAAYYNGTVVYNNGTIINNNGGPIQINGGSVKENGSVVYTNGTTVECPPEVEYEEWFFFFHYEPDSYPFDYDDGDLEDGDEGLYVEGEVFEYEEHEEIEEHEEVEEHEDGEEHTVDDDDDDDTEDENAPDDNTDETTEDETTENETTEEETTEEETPTEEPADDGDDTPDEPAGDDNTESNEEGDATDGTGDATDVANEDQGGDEGNDGGDQGNADNGDGGDAGGEEHHKVYTFHLRVGHKH